jgi:DNA-binding beta-propeller fold protein YncE
MVTVGSGKYTYEQVDGWEKLPAGWVLGQTAIVTDSKDRVFLFNRGEHPLIVLDREGNYLTSWGEGTLPDAHGMYIDADENLFMPVKNSHVVLKYDSAGNLLMTLGAWDQPSDTGWSGDYRDQVVRASGPFNSPSDVAISPTGDLYISDGYGNARVHKFTSDGRLLASWGEPGKTGHGQFHVPHGVWVHTDGRVLVADRENNRIQIVDANGGFLDQWPNLARPCDIYIDSDNVVYVPELDGFMSILSIDGTLITRWGSPSNAGAGNGAHAVWVDSHGDIYVNQNLDGQRLIKYRRTGQ